MNAPEPSWRKSSYSATNNGCVEVCGQSPSMLIRDSKNPEAGFLDAGPAQWRALLDTLR